MKDRLILQKIQKYLAKVGRFYAIIEHLTPEKIDESDESLALTQCITNIHSLIQHITNDDIISKLVIFYNANLNTCRNIAAHDYDALNWFKVKELCKKLTSEKASTAISEGLKIAELAEAEVKKYT